MLMLTYYDTFVNIPSVFHLQRNMQLLLRTRLNHVFLIVQHGSLEMGDGLRSKRGMKGSKKSRKLASASSQFLGLSRDTC